MKPPLVAPVPSQARALQVKEQLLPGGIAVVWHETRYPVLATPSGDDFTSTHPLDAGTQAHMPGGSEVIDRTEEFRFQTFSERPLS